MKIELWVDELYKYLADSINADFVWGVNDCCLWTAKFVDKITGSEIANQFLYQYHDEITANLFLQEQGFNSIAELADSYLNRINLKLAKRGDIVQHKTGALGICEGRKSYFLTEADGLIEELTLSCKRAWEVV
jgi:hypothetical protein